MRSHLLFLCAPWPVFAAIPELVLQEHVRLTATTPYGVIAVVAGSGLARTYEWDGCSLKARMLPRGTARWFGSLGIYDPAPSDHGVALLARQCKGISRTVVQEGQIHFADAVAAQDWLRRYAQVRPTVWSRDGVVVRWFTSPAREQLNVDVWQVCIANHYPTELTGATDAALQLTRLTGAGPTKHACVSVDSSVVLETQAAWQKHWESVEQWNARARPRN